MLHKVIAVVRTVGYALLLLGATLAIAYLLLIARPVGMP